MKLVSGGSCQTEHTLKETIEVCQKESPAVLDVNQVRFLVGGGPERLVHYYSLMLLPRVIVKHPSLYKSTEIIQTSALTEDCTTSS